MAWETSNGTVFKVYIWDFLKRPLFFVHKMQLLLQGRLYYKVIVVEKLARLKMHSNRCKENFYNPNLHGFSRQSFKWFIISMFFQIMWHSLCDHLWRRKYNRSSSQEPLWVPRSRKHQLFWWKQIIGRVQVSKAMYLISVRKTLVSVPRGLKYICHCVMQ